MMIYIYIYTYIYNIQSCIRCVYIYIHMYIHTRGNKQTRFPTLLCHPKNQGPCDVVCAPAAEVDDVDDPSGYPLHVWKKTLGCFPKRGIHKTVGFNAKMVEFRMIWGYPQC